VIFISTLLHFKCFILLLFLVFFCCRAKPMFLFAYKACGFTIQGSSFKIVENYKL
jgi:hypothetical protein